MLARCATNARAITTEGMVVQCRITLKGIPQALYEQLAAIRDIHQRLPKASYSHTLVDKAKRQGRAVGL